MRQQKDRTEVDQRSNGRPPKQPGAWFEFKDDQLHQGPVSNAPPALKTPGVADMIDASALTDEALTGYDEMMVETGIKVEKLSAVADTIWSDVLKELDKRQLVRLVSGSYEKLGDAATHRLYATENT